MLIIERQQKLIDMLREHKTMQLDDMAAQLGVSSSTVRRDLEVLEKQGLLERTRAGAVYHSNAVADNEPTFALAGRMKEHIDAKRRIGQKAAQMVEPGMTVLLDGGSTVIYAAQQFNARPLQVVTNSLSISNLYKDDEQIELMLIGGSLYPRTEITVGPIANAALDAIHADILMFSLAGVHDGHLFNINMSMAETERHMMKRASKKIALMDSSKFGRKSLARVCDCEELDLIITDAAIDPQWQKELGDRLVIAR
ncbi:DeoR/GlpR family DNA-binding transcription regulator [Poriferisphaera sp. WC338]|uniref:DeoR/GlpR family DNA-binding transcription regulator n=1 Tax=Poriferisphaera sp. WC338 TaxID=3425129 RepID=UPI003D813134